MGQLSGSNPTPTPSAPSAPRPAPATSRPPVPSTSRPPTGGSQNAGDAYYDQGRRPSSSPTSSGGSTATTGPVITGGVILPIPGWNVPAHGGSVDPSTGRPYGPGYNQTLGPLYPHDWAINPRQRPGGYSDARESAGVNNQSWGSATQARDELARLWADPANREWILRSMRDQGYIGEDSKAYSTVYEVWSDLVSIAESEWQKGNYISPFEFLDPNGPKPGVGSPGGGPSGGGPSGGGPSGGGGAGPYLGPVTSTNAQTDLLNRGDAEQVLDATLREFLGREATPDEVQRFRHIYNRKAKRNPRESTTVSTPVMNEVGQQTGSDSETTTRGGVNPQAQAEKFAKQSTGYSEYQAATTFMDAFRSAVMGG